MIVLYGVKIFVRHTAIMSIMTCPFLSMSLKKLFWLNQTLFWLNQKRQTLFGISATSDQAFFFFRKKERLITGLIVYQNFRNIGNSLLKLWANLRTGLLAGFFFTMSHLGAFSQVEQTIQNMNNNKKIEVSKLIPLFTCYGSSVDAGVKCKIRYSPSRVRH